MYNPLHYFFAKPQPTLVETACEYYKKHTFMAWAIIAGILAFKVFAGYSIYGWYVNNREEKAQKMLAENLLQFQHAASGKLEWSEVALMFEHAYNQASGSYLAPCFLAFQAQALQQDLQTEKALTVMNTVMQKIDKKSPLYYPYAVKQALLMLDQQDATVVAEGLKNLQALSKESANTQRDEALYFLGLYDFARGNAEQAAVIWQELITEFGVEGKGQSPWVALAQQKMA